PNFFMLVGPNTGLGHSSMVFMIEAQVEYLRSAVRTMDAHRYAAVEPTTAATDAWNADLQQRMRRTVWSTGGCSSWYLDEHGRNTILWPRTTVAFRRALADFDVAAYAVTGAQPPSSTPTPLTREVVTA
ncbi:MAG: 4-hydroxyacetophenone monooxygenase, partial [Nocardioides sp.]